MLGSRSSATKKIKRAKLQRVESIPSPIGGLNARDALSAMPPTDAFGLTNWIPQLYGVKVRKGYSEYATGMTLPVGTIMSYFSQSNTIPTTANFQVSPTTMPGKVFAATDAGIYDVTSKTATPAVAQALSNALNAGSISSVNFTNAAGSFLLCCSETDGYYTYDGTTWLKVTLGVGATQVSGFDPATFVACALWKNRVWFVQKNTSKVYYLPVNAPYGAASQLDLGPLNTHGGSIAWIANWTIDAGTGIDDMLVIATENGDIIIYKGTDPASAATFALVGVWYAGEIPKGRRSFVKYGGDLLLICNLGLIPVSYITRGGSNVLSTTSGSLTSKIDQLFAQDISTTFNFFGWDLALVPRENLLIMAVPNISASNKQYAMNSSTQNWCQFANMPISCMKVHANWLMFGTPDGRVCLAFDSFTDNNLLNGTVGSPIYGYIQPAFNYFQKEGDISAQKHYLMAQPVFLGSSEPGYSLQMNVDFNPGSPVAPPISGQAAGAVWDVARWDAAMWQGASYTFKKWNSVTGVGYAGQVSISTLTNTDTTLASIDYMMEVGGPM